jgi:exodeoxyribonuclease V alpha subunit
MKGYAQRLFSQRKGNPSLLQEKAIAWEFLQSLVDGGLFAHVDLAIAEELLLEKNENNQKAAALICLLSVAVRQGHLCIVVDADEISPNPALLWQEFENGLVISKDDALKQLTEMVVQGRGEIPESIIATISASELVPESLKKPLASIENRFYFQRHWYYETLLLQHYRRLSEAQPSVEIDQEELDLLLDQLLQGNQLLPDQASAIKNACSGTISLICGGPGTGKTYTAGRFVGLLQELAVKNEKRFEIALAAPTGKAASNLQKSLLAACGETAISTIPPAKTLHSLLNVRTNGIPKDPDSKLTADLIIIDETSMVDVRLMAYLFAAVKTGARLVMLGDPDQLPAVEAGGVFADLIQVAKSSSDQLVTTLNVCLRAELKGILSFASAVKNSDLNACNAILNQGSDDGSVCRILANEKPEEDLLHQAIPFYQVDPSLLNAPEQLLRHFDRFRILSPFRQGQFGVETINKLFVNNMLKSASPFIAPIILTKSDSTQQLFNGEVGVLVSWGSVGSLHGNYHIDRGDYAIFPHNDDKGAVRKIPALLLPAFELAYCLSVHKSQGSEFEQVLLLMPESAELFGREVLYTAITRARKRLLLWEHPGTLAATIDRRSHRLSGIQDRLKGT